MEEIYSIRRVDELGRVVLPKEIRRSLGITENTPVELSLKGNTIMIQRCSGIDTCLELAKALKEEIERNKEKLSESAIFLAKQHISGIIVDLEEERETDHGAE